MTMPSFLQNVMSGREADSREVWLVAVGQLKVELERLGQPTTARDAAFVREALDYSEAYVRLEDNACNIPLEDFEGTPEWVELENLYVNMGALAVEFDDRFVEKQKLRLQEKKLW